VFLVDASVWVTLAEAGSPYRESAMSLIREQGPSLSVLDLTLYEVANAIGVKQRAASEASRITRLLLKCCRDRVLAIDFELVESALQIASEHTLTAYDAAYVAAARRHGLTLVSIDVRDLVSRRLAVTPDAAVYP
jgi:predicted nucleic acid-binding protein